MKISRSTALAATAALGLSFGLTACGGGSDSAAGGGSDPVKMCVLVADATSSEALGFKDYYTTYIQENFPVEFVYSEEVGDADAEKRAMESFIANNCEAIISFASADRPTQIQMAEDAGIYYAVATGTLSDDQYEEFKDYQYYVGAIGPSLGVEYQAGYDMAKYFVEQGDTRFAIYGAGVPYYIDMHIYRTAGMLAALAEEPSTSYGGATDFGAILGKIMQDGTVKVADFQSDVYELTGYHEVWSFDDAAWQANLAAVVASKPDVILAAGTGFAVFGAAVADTGITIGDIDAYTDENGQAMKEGLVGYLAGKFTSSIGPIFAATYAAVEGHPIRAEGDTALALEQGYWVATSPEQFDAFLAGDTIENPFYGKAELEQFANGDQGYDTFEAFVAAYTYVAD
ncbi:hypothetical protein OEB99_08805 [Actinotalea sp. M2MS4P-6]|uniref:hypothetical protein n=1 Tax=Actinotalea sp. M2MS4P-6 TaxID=2983762 RepID=UPI0021E50A48|nr:hypothetical protein [Actinotalea sp. M2MS4P-6]MCV2394408.1 hypothetical protein [Actinotalea sp. M2MS4P-6]